LQFSQSLVRSATKTEDATMNQNPADRLAALLDERFAIIEEKLRALCYVDQLAMASGAALMRILHDRGIVTDADLQPYYDRAMAEIQAGVRAKAEQGTPQ
jgi:hypothetical protein